MMRDFYKRWTTEEFGAKSADALTAVYKEYFAAPSLRPNRFPGMPPGAAAPAAQNEPTREYGDQHYHSEIRRLLLDELSEHQVSAIPSQSPKWTPPRVVPSFDAQTRRTILDRDIQECEAAQPRWDAVWDHAVAAEALVDPDRRDYYQAGVLTMITINRESNRSAAPDREGPRRRRSWSDGAGPL